MLCLESVSQCAAGNSPSTQQKGSNPPFHGSVRNVQIPRIIPHMRWSTSVPERSDPSGNSSGRFIQSGLQRLSKLILLSGWQSSHSLKCSPGDRGPERRSNVVFLSAKGPDAWQSARVSAARVNAADNYIGLRAAVGNPPGPSKCCYLQVIQFYRVMF